MLPKCVLEDVGFAFVMISNLLRDDAYKITIMMMLMMVSSELVLVGIHHHLVIKFCLMISNDDVHHDDAEIDKFT